MDGNFKAYTKSKRFDADDTPLTDGSCFFPKWTEWNSYCEANKELPSVSLDCGQVYQSRLKAKKDRGDCPAYDKMHTVTAHRGRAVSGLCSVVCARHGIFTPLGTVDLEKGEKFVVLIHAFRLQLTFQQHVLPDGPLLGEVSRSKSRS